MVALFSEADLRRAAGERSFDRGLDYLGSVGNLEIGLAEITATVHGTDAYEVVLSLDEDSVAGGCSCPHGQEGFFCKHLVAVGLTVLRQPGGIPQQQAAAAAKAQTLESWLAGLSRDDLLTLVRDQIHEDRGLRRRLELRAAAAGPDLAAIRDRVDELLDVYGVSRHGYIEYEYAHAYAGRVAEVAAVIEELTEGGRAAEAASIARQALWQVAQALRQADDSGGWIATSADGLVIAHAGACTAAPADPVELARWLAGVVLEGAIQDFAADAYDEALGERGAAEYRRLITAAWRENPSGWREKYLMQEVLRAAGDLEALVAVYAADLLPSGYTHLMIAQELDRAGRAGAALEWAERGLREATGRVDARLVVYLADRYESSGALDRALAVRRRGLSAGR